MLNYTLYYSAIFDLIQIRTSWPLDQKRRGRAQNMPSSSGSRGTDAATMGLLEKGKVAKIKLK